MKKKMSREDDDASMTLITNETTTLMMTTQDFVIISHQGEKWKMEIFVRKFSSFSLGEGRNIRNSFWCVLMLVDII